MERSWRPNALHYQQGSPAQSPSKSQLKGKSEDMDVDDPNSRQGTSPLLTSLLKSPSPAPNPTVPILHNAMNVSGTQTRVAAPTITNLLTGSTTILTQQTMAKPIVASVVTSIATPFAVQLQAQPLTGPAPSDQSINNVPQSPSQAAPTLSSLLENKNKETISRVTSTVRIETSPVQANDAKPTTSTEQEIDATETPIKDEDQQLMEDFDGLIPEDIDELASILNENNPIILNAELLEEESILDNVDAVDLDAAVDAMQRESTDVEMAEANDEKFQESLEPEIKSDALAESAEQPKKEPNTIDEAIPDVKPEALAEVKQVNWVRLNLLQFDFLIVLSSQDESSSHSTLAELEKVASPPKDDDDSSSDLSNDTPLSELIKQETTAKAELQQKTAAAEAAAEAAAAEAPAAEADVKIEKEEPDTFESDSNDDKCLGSIKREIQSLSAQKEHENNDDSSEMPAETTAIADGADEKEEEKSEDVVVAEPAPIEADEEEPQ